jgi:hypothetical protein
MSMPQSSAERLAVLLSRLKTDALPAHGLPD